MEFSIKKPAAARYCAFAAALFFLISCSHTKDKKPYVPGKRSAGCPSSSYYGGGLGFFQEGQLAPARACFENLNYGGSDFIPALLEIQKINYIQADWSRFFGLAFYYRSKLLASEEMIADNFRQEMLALEVLALLRHCRFEEALQIMEWSLKAAEKAGKDSSKIQKAANFLKLRERVGDKPKKKWADWERRVYLWPMNPDRIRWLDNPKRLRARVKSKC